MAKALLFTLLILGPVFTSIGQNTWTKKTTFAGEKRTRSIAFSIGDFGYVGMGEDTVEMTHNDLWQYDPVLDVWTQKQTLPGPQRRNASAIAIKGKGYVGLGADSSVSWNGAILADWWEYDPGANSWSQKADYPGGYNAFNNTNSSEGVYFATAFEANNNGYVCGGKMAADFYATDIWRYDPLLDEWTRMTDFPGSDRYQMSSFSIDNIGYVGMGIDHDLYHKDWWRYDPVVDSWTEVASLPGVERGAASSFVLGQRGYVVFGSDGGFKDELWEYNPFSDSWSIKANFPGGKRKNGIAFSIGDKGYAGIGKGPSGKRRNFYEYTPLQPIGFNELGMDVAIYPNPSNDFVKLINLPAVGELQIHFYDQEGRLLLSEIVLGSQTQLNLSSLKAGSYLIMATEETGEVLFLDKIVLL